MRRWDQVRAARGFPFHPQVSSPVVKHGQVEKSLGISHFKYSTARAVVQREGLGVATDHDSLTRRLKFDKPFSIKLAALGTQAGLGPVRQASLYRVRCE